MYAYAYCILTGYWVLYKKYKIQEQPQITDFSTEVIPEFLGKISTWHNNSIHRDIGTLDSLEMAQKDLKLSLPWKEIDEWQADFTKHQIHKMIRNCL